MKKISSAVWKFFERIEENGRCIEVICKLCENQYKYFGNTTNLRVHLINKHPVQWELSENGTLDEANFPSTALHLPTPTKRRNHKAKASASKDVASDSNDEDESTINLVRQMHGDQNSDEEWLEEDAYQVIESYEPKRKRKYKKIKREIPSPTELPNFFMAKPDNVYEETKKNDEYSVFGEYVANKLRKIKTSRTKGNLQQLITTILWQAEYGLYDNVDAVQRVLLMNIPSDVEYQIETQTDSSKPEVTTENISPNQNSNDSTSVLS